MERILKEKLKGGMFQGGTSGNTRRMKAIRDRNNKSTEKRFRSLLVRSGVRGWKLRPAEMVGKPDFYFPAQGVVIFIDGCFWHGCLRGGHVPGVNRPYWQAKIQRNRQRDEQNAGHLEERGLRVLRLWEHELQEDPAGCLTRLNALLCVSPASQGPKGGPRPGKQKV